MVPQSVPQSGYRREGAGSFKRNLPPLEFSYSSPQVQETVEEVDAQSLENLPVGLGGGVHQWTDLHGEGIPGIFTEQGGGWFYHLNLSPINESTENGTARTFARFAPVEAVAVKPNLSIAGDQAQFIDLAGDSQPDLVVAVCNPSSPASPRTTAARSRPSCAMSAPCLSRTQALSASGPCRGSRTCRSATPIQRILILLHLSGSSITALSPTPCCMSGARLARAPAPLRMPRPRLFAALSVRLG